MMVATKILIGATGSVASLKIPILAKSLLDLNEQGFDFEVRIVVTEKAKHFFQLTELPSVVPIYDDALEWNAWKDRGDPVLHVDLGKWADLMVIAPLDANTLAKMAQGICDNLLTCTTRAWDLSKPLIFCPSMNTRMWQHPITAAQIATLKEWGHEEIPPIEKLLICGDKGMGAMAEVATIVNRVKNIASLKS
ncbi:phosphopantothenoylcysteine decarboxylase isoform X1 [Plodia interpunctella]|uniref:phosphopantothenoylcysteine decarboxylase isoform X1 n=1 Tax=Plodia interpunctella TaxID=58824 RepID=UPI002368ED03|nr:phosphopantothenoylcysteine decarboxylase isoform X1 [Plodia interpunctella]